MANLINLKKFSNYKTISLAQLIFLAAISFMDTYFYFSNQLAESKTVKESLKRSITEKRIFGISPKNNNYVYFLQKKSITIFCFFACLVVLKRTRYFLPTLFFNTPFFPTTAFLSTTAFFFTTAVLSITAFFFTTPFYFFTAFHHTALLH